MYCISVVNRNEIESRLEGLRTSAMSWINEINRLCRSMCFALLANSRFKFTFL